MRRVKIGAIMWSGHLTALVEAAKRLDFVELLSVSSKRLEKDEAVAEEFVRTLADCDAVILFRSSEEFWKRFETELKVISEGVPTVSFGYDPSYLALSTVAAEKVRAAQRYVTDGGVDNFENLLRYLAADVCGLKVDYAPPRRLPWDGIYHPDAREVFTDVEEYLRWRGYSSRPLVGILFSRFNWVNSNCETEAALIASLEARGLGVIAVFSSSSPDETVGSKGAAWAVRRFFIDSSGGSRVQLLLKLMPFPIGARAPVQDGAGLEGTRLFRRLGVPVLSPVYSYRKTIEEWERDEQGLGGDVGWTMAMPEFEGVIEPLIAAAAEEAPGLEDAPRRVPIVERVERIVGRILAWVRLRATPPQKRKVVFFLHNNPCAGAEMSVGGGAGLDTFESLARILKRMRERGYVLDDAPETGKEIAEAIMERKAVSEFRWTTVEEIVAKGGALAMLSEDEYRKWFDRQDERLRERVIKVWGEPPGREMNGVPPAMLYDGKIVITGLRYGNVVVCAQPKRGCAGARCDGQVCRILHDPDIPPPHQYFATYRYLEEEFGAQVVVHVGTHGNLEFLPGKGTGLSAACSPDAAIGTVPHLYIYNSDNPPEGIVAKRRSYAVLVDHMQTVMKLGGLYEALEELDRLLAEYGQAKISDKARAHALEHLIKDAIKAAHLDADVDTDGEAPFEETVRRTHEALSLLRNTRVQDGLHILGEVPRGERKAHFVFSMLRCEQPGEASLRGVVAGIMGFDLTEALENEGGTAPDMELPYGVLIEKCDRISLALVDEFMRSPETPIEEALDRVLDGKEWDGRSLATLSEIKRRVLDISARIDSSKEVEALLSGFDGRYIPPGPSGLIARGRDDVLPTGRNFYSLDPYRVPTKAAWKVGVRLAEAVVERYRSEHDGRFPENIAVYWMASDIMWSDGEMMAQIMHLLGARPRWMDNGRLEGFDVVPLDELGRPRIDVTIRVSAITRDNFRNCMEFVDEVIQTIAALDEPLDSNFPRKHTIEKMGGVKDEADVDGERFRDAALRIFSARPGTYGSGVNIAVYASAWKTAEDLAAIFVHHNGYAYGKGVFGKRAYEQLSSSLKTVEVTYNKVVSDEHDLFGCCCYFGTHGGMTAAARVASGKDVTAYYGDTRQPLAPKLRTLSEEVRRVVRTRLLNPQYIEGMKRHGYRGAAEFAKRFGRLFGWEASTQEVDDWIFDEAAQRFALDEEMREWFEENNPWALEEMVRRLLEANQRGLWNADPDLLEKLEGVYMEIEGWLEEAMGETGGDFQGGAVDILGFDQVEVWKDAIAEAHRSLLGGRDE